MPDPGILTIVAVAFVLAGAAKGIVGFGIQVVALAIMTIALDLLTAMAVLLAPAIATNIWQATTGSGTLRLLRRLGPFLLAVAIAVFVGALALSRIELPWLTALLGLVLVGYSLVGLGGFGFRLSPVGETWLGPVFGAANGLIMGMTGSSVVPGTLYLQSLGLHRDTLLQAMGMLYMVCAVALAIAMQAYSLLTVELAVYSACAIVPALFGMWIGQGVRRRIPEPLFRRVFFLALMALGAYLLAS